MLVNLLFNSFGYRIIAFVLEERAGKIKEAQFDNHYYNEADLVEIKIPFKLPYSTAWKDFERIDGEISIKGKYYKYVKRKVIVDSLVLLCLPDHDKARLESAHGKFFELVNGLKLPLQKKTESSVLKTLISDYLARNNSWSLSALPVKNAVHILSNTSFISQFSYQKLVKPPRFS
jgi:hypothetical protein